MEVETGLLKHPTYPEAESLDKSLKSFPSCYSQPPLLAYFTSSKSGLKLVCNVNIVYGNLKSENSQDYAQKPQQNCTFMNSASGQVASLWENQPVFLNVCGATESILRNELRQPTYVAWRAVTITLFLLGS